MITHEYKIVDLDNFPVNEFDYVVLVFGLGNPIRTKFRGIKYYESNGYYHARFGENNGSMGQEVYLKDDVIKIPAYLAQNQDKDGFLRIFTKANEE